MDRGTGKLHPGTVLFGYQILEQIGEGAFANVYKAHHLRLPMLVAIKQLKPQLTEDKDVLQRFLREAAIIAQLNHPNVVGIKTLEYDTSANLHYIITEFAEKGTLADLLIKYPMGLPIDQAVHIVMQICSGLDVVHRRGIIHRDIKPSNVFLFDVGEKWDVPKIGDFGIARPLSISNVAESSFIRDAVSETSGTIGTLWYMSPEQLDENLKVDHRSDLYALGILFYELLVGQVPFIGAMANVVWAHAHLAPAPPSKMRPEISESLERIVLRSLSKKPQQRYQSAAEMRQELDAFFKSAYQKKSQTIFERSKANVQAYCQSLAQRAEYAQWADHPGALEIGQDHFVQIESKTLPLDALSFEDESEQPRENLLKSIREKERLLVLGEPGVGKTVALQRIIWEMASSQNVVVPIHILFSDYDGNLMAEVHHALTETGDLQFGNDEDLKVFLQQNRCLFLLDGLNEVRRDQRGQAARDIGNLMHTFRHHRYVITSRLQDRLWQELRDKGFIKHAVVVQTITDAQAREYFVAHLGQQTGSETYDSLSDRLRSMAQTVLFLSMLKEIRQSGGEVPGNRGDLIDHYVESLFTRDEEKLEISLSRSIKKSGLASLAYWLQSEHRVSCSEQEAVDAVAQAGISGDPHPLIHEACIHGLLKGGQQLRFLHQAIQDYFAAVELGKRLAVEEEAPALQQIGKRFLRLGPASLAKDDWWAESFVQLAGITDETSQLIHMLNRVRPWLALWCVIEGRPVDQRLAGEIESNTAGSLQSDNLSKRKNAVKELCKIKNPRTAQYLIKALEDGSSEVVNMAVQGLGNLGESAVEYLRPCLDKNEQVRQAATRVLGHVWQMPELENLGAPAADSRIQALGGLAQHKDLRTIEAILAVAGRDSDVRVRQYAIRALGMLGDVQVVRPLAKILKEGDISLRIEAAAALGFLGSERAVDSLVAALEENHQALRFKCISALGRIWKLPSLIQLGEDNASVRQKAVANLQEQGDMRLVAPLVAALRDPNKDVCAYAAAALGKLGDPRAIRQLVAVLRASEEALCRANAAEALGNLGGEQVIEPLGNAMYDLDAKVRRSAVVALGRQKNKQVARPLMDALQDHDREVRQQAVIALGNLREERAIQPLILSCQNRDVHDVAAKALGQIGVSAIDPLIAALQDQDQNVRLGAIQALGYIRDERSFTALLTILKENRDQNMRARTALALGHMKDPRAVQGLIASLKQDSSKVVRLGIVISLGQLGGPEAVNAMISLLQDPQEDESVWRGVIDALGRMWNMPDLCSLCNKSPVARSQAAVALGRSGDKRAIEPLLAVLRDRNELPRLRALCALGQIWSIPALVSLGSEQPPVRRDAALGLGQLKDDRVVSPLIATLQNDSQPLVRAAAAKALGMIQTETSVDPLIGALDDDEKCVRQEAARSLHRLAQWAVPRLIDVLQDSEHWLQRRGAAEALGHIHEPAALREALHHHDRHVRRSAIESLAEMASVQDMQDIVRAMSDQDHYVRRKAAEILGKSDDPLSIEPLRRALENDSDWHVRRVAAESLGQCGDASVVESLIAALNDDDWLVRETAAKSLGKLHDERAVSSLIDAMSGTWPALWTVAEALGELENDQAVSCLTDALQDAHGDRYVQDAAVEALGRIGEPIQKRLVGILQSPDEHARQRAIEALGQMRDARDLSPLIDTLCHGETYHVHQGASDALVKLGETAVDPLIAVVKDVQHYGALERRWAIYTLGRIRNARAIEPLKMALLDNAPLVHKAALEALSLFDNSEAQAAVLKYKSHKNI